MTGHPMALSVWTPDTITTAVVLDRGSQAEVLLP
jgi:hypothetical protein